MSQQRGKEREIATEEEEANESDRSSLSGCLGMRSRRERVSVTESFSVSIELLLLL